MKRFWKRGAIGALTALGGLWAAIHLIPGAGPAVADGVRAVVGPGPVAWAEDVVYGVEDRIKRVVYRDAAPKTFWEAPPAAPEDHAPAQPAIAESAPVAPTFAPAAFAPPFANVATPGDGQWLSVVDPTAPDQPPAMHKTLVHPDPKRSYAAVAIVAVDLERLELSLAGTLEPASAVVPPSERPGLVPSDRFPELVAAFNGGFKAEHGHYGMMLGGRTFLAPRAASCTIALYKGGALRVGTWTALKQTAADMAAFRQTPPCLVEQGAVNDTLAAADGAHGWGAAVGGETVIRRSALGLDRSGKILLYGLGESVTAGTLARAMKAAGAEDAAQLDVNQAYPRFVFYGRRQSTERPTVASALIPDIAFSRHEYVGKPEGRDFFYLTRKTL